MATPITYDGIPGSSGGSLFGGRKFWIAQRVPMRSHLLQLVESNGGQVVRLEKLADMLIADHVRSDVPPNSYSWQFIEFSVKKGCLEDEETHLIRPARATRAVGSTQLIKGARRPFSAEDDDVLTKWVLHHMAKGGSVSGNKIYIDLESKYPHHTWQSWRDRWVKRLSRIQPPQIEIKQETAEPELEPNSEATLPPAGTAIKTEDISLQSPLSSIAPQPRRHAQATTGSRVRYSEEEDRLLTRYVKEAIRNGQRVQGNKIYVDFAANHPSRSWHSWRDRWVRHLGPRYEQQNGDDEVVQAVPSTKAPQSTPTPRSSDQPVTPSASVARSAAPGSRDSRVGTRSNETKEKTRPTEGRKRDTAVVSSSQSTPKRQEANRAALPEGTPDKQMTQALSKGVIKRDTPRHHRDDAEEEIDDEPPQRTSRQPELTPIKRGRQEDIGIQTDSDLLEKPPPRQHVQEVEVIDEAESASENEEEPYELPHHHQKEPHDGQNQGSRDHPKSPLTIDAPGPLEDTSEEEDQNLVPGWIPPRTNQTQFYMDLSEFTTATGKKINLCPEVGGKFLDLWGLWSVVTAQKVPPESRDWETIASALGYDWVFEPLVTTELKKTFEALLGEFEAALQAFEQYSGDDVDEDDENEDDDDEPPAAEESSAEEPEPEGFIRGLKRGFARAIGFDTAGYSSSPASKRTRTSRDVEIPSTPDDKTGTADLRRRRRVDFSSPSQRTLSPSKLTPVPQPRHTDRIEGSRQAKPRIVEPETQDFGFDNETQAAVILESQLESQSSVSPSQQLRSEMANASPLPIRPGMVRQSDLTGDAADLITGRLSPFKRTDRSSKSASLGSGSRSSDDSSPGSRARAEKETPTPPLAGPSETSHRRSGSLGGPADIERFISMGYPIEIVLQALKATTLLLGDAGYVMENILKKRGVPDDRRGIWTDRDDADLALLDATTTADPASTTTTAEDRAKARRAEAARRRLEAKHGVEGIKERREFLPHWSEVRRKFMMMGD